MELVGAGMQGRLIGCTREAAERRTYSESRVMLATVALRPCIVSFKDMRGIRHAAEIEAESLYEAAVLGIRRLNEDPWLEKIGAATVLEVEVRNPGTTHALSLQQVERWLAGATTNPNEASKKVKLKMLLMRGQASATRRSVPTRIHNHSL
jgi:hypothetical protein